MAYKDIEKAVANENIAVFIGPTGGAFGVTNVGEPLPVELNNTGGSSGMLSVAEAISFNDWSFGMDASETNNEPSLADASTAETFGLANFGGSFSPYYPKAYDDSSNLISNLYDMIDTPGSKVDIATRIDGDVDQSEDAADGDFVSVYRVQREGETNPFTPGESKRYVASFIPKTEFSHVVVAGDHAVTAIEPASFAAGSTGRIRAAQQGRDVTCYLEFTTDDATVIDVYPGGFYKVTGTATDTATVTVTDPVTGDNDTVAVTVS